MRGSPFSGFRSKSAKEGLPSGLRKSALTATRNLLTIVLPCEFSSGVEAFQFDRITAQPQPPTRGLREGDRTVERQRLALEHIAKDGCDLIAFGTGDAVFDERDCRLRHRVVIAVDAAGMRHHGHVER